MATAREEYEGIGKFQAQMGNDPGAASTMDDSQADTSGLGAGDSDHESVLDLRQLRNDGSDAASKLRGYLQAVASRQAASQPSPRTIDSSRVASPASGNVNGIGRGVLQGLIDAMHAYGDVAEDPQTRLKKQLVQETINARKSQAAQQSADRMAQITAQIQDRQQRAQDAIQARKDRDAYISAQKEIAAQGRENWVATSDGQHLLNRNTGEVRPIGESVGKKGRPDLKYAPGTSLPTHYVDADGTTYVVGDPNMPDTGKSLIDAAVKNHKQRLQEESDIKADADVRAQDRFMQNQRVQQGMKDSEEGRKAATELAAVDKFAQAARQGNVWASQNLLYQHVRANVQGAGRMTQAELQYAMKAGSFGDRITRWFNMASNGTLRPEDITDITANIKTGFGEKVRSARDSWEQNMPKGSKLPKWLQDTGTQPSAQPGNFQVTAPNGKLYTFPDQQSANAFKQKAGIR